MLTKISFNLKSFDFTYPNLPLLTFALAIFFNLGDSKILAQWAPCPFTPINHGFSNATLPDQNPYIEATDRAGIERYLARALDCKFIIETSRGAGAIQEGCGDPCDEFCQSYRCCDKYARFINTLSSVNTSYLAFPMDYHWDDRAFVNSEADLLDRPDNSAWADPSIDPFITSARRFVNDVNTAYDINNLRRPIIEAFLGEFLSQPIAGTEFWAGIPVNKVVIPRQVIELFRQDIVNSGQSATYFNVDNTPRQGLHFNRDLMGWNCLPINFYPLDGDQWSLDVNKLQGRMWLFFVCKQFIDWGYTSIHLSQIEYWIGRTGNPGEYGFHLPDTEIGLGVSRTSTQQEKESSNFYYSFDARMGYFHLTNTLQMLRTYAQTVHNRLVVFNTQNDRLYYEYILKDGQPIKATADDGRFIYMFDFNTAGAWPREVDEEHFGGQFGSGVHRNLVRNTAPFYPTQPQMPVGKFDAAMPSCTILRATIDPGNGVHHERNGSGYSSRPWTNFNNKRYFENAPTLIYFDLGGGANPTAGQYSFPHKTWNYDDTRWFYEFANSNGNACAINWVDFQYQNVKKFGYFNWKPEDKPFTFLTIPGRERKSWSVPAGDNFPGTNNDIVKGPFWSIDAPENEKYLEYLTTDLWGVNLATFKVEELEEYQDVCPVSKKKCIMRKSFYLTVTNPDKSSIYTWHIQRADGSWEEMTYGTERIYQPLDFANFTVSLSQDNLGIMPYGVHVESKQVNNSGGNCITCGPWFSTNDVTTRTNGNFDFNISPNPVSDRLEINFSENILSPISYYINDINGKTLFNGEISNNTDLSA